MVDVDWAAPTHLLIWSIIYTRRQLRGRATESHWEKCVRADRCLLPWIREVWILLLFPMEKYFAFSFCWKLERTRGIRSSYCQLHVIKNNGNENMKNNNRTKRNRSAWKKKRHSAAAVIGLLCSITFWAYQRVDSSRNFYYYGRWRRSNEWKWMSGIRNHFMARYIDDWTMNATTPHIRNLGGK